MNTSRQVISSAPRTSTSASSPPPVGSDTPRPVALVTGGSSGLGLSLTTALAAQGWAVATDARDAAALERATAGLGPHVHAIPGDVTDLGHRADLLSAVSGLSRQGRARLDLLVNNASTLGASPLPLLADLASEVLHRAWQTNLAAPLELIRAALPLLRASGGVVVNITSDAAVEHYPTWGAYGATKAALEHLTATLAAEEGGSAPGSAGVTAYAVDPGDMRTRMHQDAFPGEDISDRPAPETVVPAILSLLQQRPPSGRYRAAEFAAAAVEAVAR